MFIESFCRYCMYSIPLIFMCNTSEMYKIPQMCCMCYSLYDERFVVLRPDSGWCWRTCLPSCVCGLEGDLGDCQSQGQLMWMKGRWDKHILIKITFSFHLLIHSLSRLEYHVMYLYVLISCAINGLQNCYWQVYILMEV